MKYTKKKCYTQRVTICDGYKRGGYNSKVDCIEATKLQ